MFRKLRFRLMLVNLSVIAFLFCFLIIGTYSFVQHKMLDAGEHIMSKLSHDLLMGDVVDAPPPDNNLAVDKFREIPTDRGPNGGNFMDLPPNHGPGPLMFFIKTNWSGDIIKTSYFIPLTKNQISELVLQIQATRQSKGNLAFNQTEYFFQLTPIPNSQDLFIIFQDFERDRSILNALVTGLSITGLICMIFSLLGSLFIANKAMIPIQAAWQQQKDFLADASHEFRTPLAVIQTNLEIVRDNPTETVQSQGQWLNNIYEETLCMTQLVESLLFLARADSHQQLLTKTYFFLDQATITATELFQPLADNKEISLVFEITPDIPYYGDESKLRQVISILLDNAIRHTPLGGEVTVRLVQSQQGIALSITDTGEGIPTEHLAKIFERFYQSDSSRAKGGAGLGLSIAKWIIENHNGTLQAQSTLGKGSVFAILLPQQEKT